MTVNIAELLQRANIHVQNIAQTMILNQRETFQDKAPLLARLLVDLTQVITAEATDEDCVKAMQAKWPDFLPFLKYLLSDSERQVLSDVRAFAKTTYEAGPAAPHFCRALLLSRLLLKPYEVEHPADLVDLPPDLAGQAIDYFLEPVRFIDRGDQAGYARHMEKMAAAANALIDEGGSLHKNTLLFLERFVSAFPQHSYAMSDGKILPLMSLRNRVLRILAMRMCPSLSLQREGMPRNNRKKIRLGVVLKTFMCGVETWAALASIAALDRDRYEIVLLCLDNSIGYTHDIRYYKEILSLIDEVLAVPLCRVEDTVSYIRGLDLDILWHQTHLGLSDIGTIAIAFVYQLARFQMADFAMHAFTTGNPFYTHFFGIEPLIEGRRWADDFSETYLYSKGIHIYIPNTWEEPPNLLIEKGDLGIKEEEIVYFVSAAAAKYTADSFAVWLRILKKVPKGILVLAPANPAWNPRPDQVLTFHALIDKAVKASGVDPSRIKILPHVNGRAIAHMHAWGDVYLSSYPYGGVTSLSDALRGGLCPVSAACQSARGCGEAPILEGYGLLDLMARTEEAYEDLAVRLGLDAAYRAEIKERVRTAWATRRDGMKEAIAKQHADLIDEVAKGLA